MPFPSMQGTQAAIAAIMSAEIQRDSDASLLTYAHGRVTEIPEWRHFRIPNWIRDSSFRSGPSLRKVAQDVQLTFYLRTLFQSKPWSCAIAHHVEAAMAAWVAGVRPWVFFAHTLLEPELPTYFAPRYGPGIARMGAALDIFLGRRANAVAAVSPAIASALSERCEREVFSVPIPWSVPIAISSAERQQARRRLGISSGAEVILYTGNLDAYQGIDVMIAAVVKSLRRKSTRKLLVATASDCASLIARFRESGVHEDVMYAALGDEDGRRCVHAAADVALVPRRSIGGLPIKLLDALARGVPTVASRRALAGEAFDNALHVVNDDDPEAMCEGIERVLASSRCRLEFAKSGPAFIRAHHSVAAFEHAMIEVESCAGIEHRSV